MSSSPHDPQEEGEDKQNHDELDEPNTAADAEGEIVAADEQTPAKRGRGRPKGSKNKRTAAASSSSAPAPDSSTPTIPRKRGRPPKERKDDLGTDEPLPKRKRGRPPKIPKPETGDGGGTSGDAAESSTKKKRGRPPKKAKE